MIVLTGDAGFIGSNIIKRLNLLGYDKILVVDDLSDGRKIINFTGCKFLDYLDFNEFRKRVAVGDSRLNNLTAILHQGACSSTSEWDGQYLMDNNYEYSKELLIFAIDRYIPFIYASSASVYGLGKKGFSEFQETEQPINMYAFSKYMFDMFVKSNFKKFKSQVVGLRYFNVYGPNESHKGNMQSPITKFFHQLNKTGKIQVFAASHGYDDGGHERDFVFVEDIAKLNTWFWENPTQMGVFNAGCGKTASFLEVAQRVINYVGKGSVEIVPFPENLVDSYQPYTCANLNNLREIHADLAFTPLDEGIKATISYLTNS